MMNPEKELDIALRAFDRVKIECAALRREVEHIKRQRNAVANVALVLPILLAIALCALAVK